MLLLNRSIIVTILSSAGSIEITDLRISFVVKKTLDSSKNEMVLKIYNLNKDTRSRLEEDDVQIVLQAGYADIPEILFVGDITSAIHPRQGADIISTMECGDGNKALKSTFVSESFAPGTTVKDIVNKLGKSFSLPVKELPEGLEDQFANGTSLIGLAKDSLDQLAKSFNFDWSIQDNEVQIIRKQDTTIDEEVVLTSTTGLIGIPEKLVSNINKLPNDPNNKSIGIKAVSLLQPKLLPGRKTKIESKLLTGSYKVENVTHRGDTHGQEWLSEFEGTET